MHLRRLFTFWDVGLAPRVFRAVTCKFTLCRLIDPLDNNLLAAKLHGESRARSDIPPLLQQA